MHAMILAAGRGERMRPLTDALPKPLLQVGGKPLIVWHLENLAHSGFRYVVINHAWLGEKIEAALGDGRQLGLEIRYSPEREALETAGGIARALMLLGKAPFAVINGDIYADFDFSRLIGRVKELPHDTLAHLVLVPNPPHHPHGDFALDHHLVHNQGVSRFTFSGIGIYRPELFSGVLPGTRAALAPLLTAQMELGRITGELHTGVWLDVGTPKRLQQLDHHLSASRTSPS